MDFRETREKLFEDASDLRSVGVAGAGSPCTDVCHFGQKAQVATYNMSHKLPKETNFRIAPIWGDGIPAIACDGTNAVAPTVLADSETI